MNEPSSLEPNVVDYNHINNLSMARQWTLFPINNQKHYEMYKQQCASFWIAEIIDFTRDKKDLEALDEKEKQLLFKVLSFFAASDALVSVNLVEQFFSAFKDQEIRSFYAVQIAQEAIHQEVYSLAIDSYVADPDLKADLFNGIETSETIKAKAKFCFKYMDTDIDLSKRMVAYACVEAILFASSFTVIYYFKKRNNRLPGLSLANEYIQKDESLHALFTCLVYKTHCERLSTDIVHEIVSEAVDAECAFVDECIPEALLGFTAHGLKTYVKFIADRLLVDLECEKMYLVANPLEWMDIQGLQRRTNFFESHVTEYRLGMPLGSTNAELVFDADF